MITWFKRLILSKINTYDKRIEDIRNIQELHIKAYQDLYRESYQCAVYELKLSFLLLKKEMLRALLPKK